MSELRPLLDNEAHRIAAAPGALELVLRRAGRKRLTRRIGSGVFALIVATVAIGAFVAAFNRGEKEPALPPIITKKNVADLRLAWTAAPGGCCPMPAVVGDNVYVGWNDGVTAYPVYCATGGATCKPSWVGSVADVSHHPKTTLTDYGASRLQTPVVGDGMIFSNDYYRLYAFPIDCASGGATCKPSWFAKPPTPDTLLSMPVVANGLVFVGGGDHNLYAYPTHCGTQESECSPSWSAKGGDGAPAVSNGVVYAYNLHRLFAYRADCRTDGSTCKPLWRSTYVKAKLLFSYSPPVVANGLVYVGGGSQLYGFPTSCGTGGATCGPAWVGSTGEPGGGVISWTVDDGMAFAITTRGGQVYTSLSHVYGFATNCGKPICDSVWSTKLADDAYLLSRDGLLFVATHGGFMATYDERCLSRGQKCKPLWSIATFDAGAAFAPPILTDRALYEGGDTGRIYAYSVPGNGAGS